MVPKPSSGESRLDRLDVTHALYYADIQQRVYIFEPKIDIKEVYSGVAMHRVQLDI